jgi:hypothetical protein
MLSGCSDQVATPDDLPAEVPLRTATQSFNSRWDFALRGGRIWLRSDEHDWELLGKSGLPEGLGVDTPDSVVAISADGVHLTALSDEGVLFRGTNMQRDVRNRVTWHQAWGWPMARGPGLDLLPGVVAWAVSDSHPSNVATTTDVFGVDHSVGAGIAHLYALDSEGVIRFNDWWLPADWSRRICGPERGEAVLAGLSASGSTLFVVAADGALYTRHHDLDRSGENELLTYSFVGSGDNVRGLPGHPWVRQPSPSGSVTSRVSIAQTGEGDSARMLRVEGEQEGALGYFEKGLEEQAWDFVETGLPQAPLLDGEGLRELQSERFTATLSRQDSDEVLQVEVSDYDLFCSPSAVHIEGVELQLHLVHVMVDEVRELDFWHDGAPVRAALMAPDPVPDSLRPWLGDEGVLNLVGTATEDGIELVQIERGDRYHVPRDEKGDEGSLVRLSTR